uniref:C2H2-type domain-containing protein n=1 Tax=Pseudo-nitzschia australis TaxID=44445 RepID=A0A7S4EED9_9STRA
MKDPKPPPLSSIKSTPSTTATGTSNVFSKKKRRRKRLKDSPEAVMESTLLSSPSSNAVTNRGDNRHQKKGRKNSPHEEPQNLGMSRESSLLTHKDTHNNKNCASPDDGEEEQEDQQEKNGRKSLPSKSGNTEANSISQNAKHCISTMVSRKKGQKQWHPFTSFRTRPMMEESEKMNMCTEYLEDRASQLSCWCVMKKKQLSCNCLEFLRGNKYAQGAVALYMIYFYNKAKEEQHHIILDWLKYAKGNMIQSPMFFLPFLNPIEIDEFMTREDPEERQATMAQLGNHQVCKAALGTILDWGKYKWQTCSSCLKNNTSPTYVFKGRRPNNLIVSNKPGENQEYFSATYNANKSSPSDTSSRKQGLKARQIKEVPKHTKRNELVDESPEKNEPKFKLPPELVPYNKPGVCDYGVIRTSRLRNRTKKTDTPDDILYQNIQGQRRCTATKNGRVSNATSINNRCLNCAEGVFKYCHTHRELDPDQKLYWDKRRGLVSNNNSNANTGRSSSTIKSSLSAKTKTKSEKMARTKANQTTLSGSQKKGSETKVSYECNDVKQCGFLMMKGNERRRCSRCILTTQPGFCMSHVRFAPSMKNDEFFREHPGTMRCTAVSKAGTMCRYKAIDQVVFCSKHISLPPEKVSPIAFVTAKKMKNGNMTDSAKRLRGEIRKIKNTVARNSVGDLTTNMNSSQELELTTKRSKRSKYASTSRSSFAGNDEVPKNIEFTREIAIPEEKLELATSFGDRCNYIYKSNRCSYKCVEGDILCFKCRQCEEEGEPFDHILLHDPVHTDEKMFSSNKCINVNRGVQCQEVALEGEIFCTGCFQSFNGKKKSMFELSENSDESETEDSSDKIDASDSSGDRETDTSFSDSDDSEESHGSDDTDYDAYCMAYTHQEFFNMWKNFERKTEKLDEVEDSKLIKRANNSMDPMDTDGQVKAQYGRVLPRAMKKMIQILELGRDDIFLDIGHGVGNTCLHASFCIGCDSRGIEVVSDRHEIAEKFLGGMYAEHNGMVGSRPKVGNVDLRCGRLEDPLQKDFLTNGVTRAYVNNFNGVFAERSSKNNDKWFLDDYISGIFASMAPGAIMVTFHPLNLALDRDSAKELRNRHDLEESEHASYYHSEKILLGKAWNSVKWNKRSGNTNEIYVYKYRRLHQPNHHDAVFLCCNPTCKIAKDMIPIPSTTLNEDGRCVINHCVCKYSPKNLRKRFK